MVGLDQRHVLFGAIRSGLGPWNFRGITAKRRKDRSIWDRVSIRLCRRTGERGVIDAVNFEQRMENTFSQCTGEEADTDGQGLQAGQRY